MAITKLLHINSKGVPPYTWRLKNVITYILNPHKTEEGVLTGAVNCNVYSAYEQMVTTKEFYGKTDLRQGYHFIISFAPGETDAKTATEIVGEFVREYLGKRYEAVYAVHDNTEAIHGHVVFNSVSFLDGRKYHYNNGEWRSGIQPIVNRLCAEHGLSVMDVNKKGAPKPLYKDIVMGATRLGVFKPMILRDLDAAIILASDFEGFKTELKERGYEVKCGKYFAVKPPDMKRFCRTKSLGAEYSEEMIRKRIKRESYLNMRHEEMNTAPHIKKCYCGKIGRRQLSPIQKKFVAKLYRTGRLKKRPYSQVYKHKDEIKRLKELQEQSLMLLRYDIKDVNDLARLKERLGEERKRVSKEKKRLYRDQKVFDGLTPDLGYTDGEIAEIRAQVDRDLTVIKADEAKVRKELLTLDRIIRDTVAEVSKKKAALEKGKWAEMEGPEDIEEAKAKTKTKDRVPAREVVRKEREYVLQR